MRRAFKRYLGAAIVAVTGLYAPLGVALIALKNIAERKPAAPRHWLLLGLAFAVLTTVGPILRHDVGSVAHLVAQGMFLALVGILVSADRQDIATGMFVSLVVITAAIGIDSVTARHTWVDTTRGTTVAEAAKRLFRPTSMGPDGTPRYRSWDRTDTSRGVTLHVQLRHDAGSYGWDWNSSTQAQNLHPVSSDQGTWTRFTPVGENPFIYRGFDLGQAIAGRTFHASVALRSEGTPRCGRLYLAERGARYRKGLDVCPGTDWATYTLSWTTPSTASGNEIDIILNDFHGGALDIRPPALAMRRGQTWTPLTPLSPEGVAISLSWGPGAPWAPDPSHTRTVHVVPAQSWTSYTIDVPGTDLKNASQIWARLQPERGLLISARHTSLTSSAPGSGSLRTTALSRPGRERLWFGAFNLAGHAILLDGLVLVAATDAPVMGLIGVLLAGFGIVATGSRAAFVAGLVGFPWLLWFLLAPRLRKRFAIFVAGCGAILALAVRFHLLGRIQIWSASGLSDPVSRQAIWRVAWDAFREQPWTGIGGGNSFATYWHLHEPGGLRLVVTHAHNLFLQYGAAYGTFGLIAVIGLTVGLVALGWSWGRWRGLALTVPVVVLQAVDVTLFYTAVLVPLVLGLNALRGTNDR